MLFAQKLFPQYAQCSLKMGRFKGTTRSGDFIDNQQVYGNIFKLLTEADHFMKRHLPIASLFSNDSFERIDEPALPVLAVREAMVNAVCHKDYSEQTSSITLAIFDDRLEIWNYGTLPSKLKLGDLRKTHNSFPRNKLIANVLYSRKFFEKWGSGTTKMIDLCREQGVSEPEFEEYSGGLAVIFKFKEPIGVTKSTESNIHDLHTLSPRQRIILKILSHNKVMTLREVAAQLENAPALRTIGDDLAYLKSIGLVKVEGRAKAAHWSLVR